MLNRLYEWFRLADLKPSSETIDKRRAAIQDIVATMDSATDWDLVLGCVAGVVGGFDRGFENESPVVVALVDSIRKHESAFPRDLIDNALELRACAAVALGEIVVRQGDKSDEDVMVVSSLLRSGLGIRPVAKEKHLKQTLEELNASASRALAVQALAQRERHTKLVQKLQIVPEPADPAAAWKALAPVVREIAEQSVLDREEIDVLWWMFSGYSNSMGQMLTTMAIGAAILSIGYELGGVCLLPPAPSADGMVRRSYESGRKPAALTERPLSEIAGDWSADLLKKTFGSDPDARAFAREHASIVPMSWLCDRILTTGPDNWATEFTAQTGILPNQTHLPASWASQAFAERIAYRTYKTAFSE